MRPAARWHVKCFDTLEQAVLFTVKLLCKRIETLWDMLLEEKSQLRGGNSNSTSRQAAS